MHKVVYLPLAESDLMDALGYIAYTLDAPKAARDLLAEFDETVSDDINRHDDQTGDRITFYKL